MPKRNDIQKILIIGSGPIIIGQACEFDYSGAQACKALREEGYTIVLVNSNPATIMTDPEMADRTYIEPLVPHVLEKIIERERPHALLPTIGGQTGLNLAVDLAQMGVLDRWNVELIGAKLPAIQKAEDRSLFKEAMNRIGLELPRSYFCHSIEEAMAQIDAIGFPVVIRPSFTLGGTGGNIAYNRDEFERMVKWGLDASPISEVLVEESVIGWKEYELEVMRDGADNVVIICSIENFDPMGIHTGDSITVAPAQTLSDKEYQAMRDAAAAVIREIGVDTGGSNIQFAVDPATGRMVVIEMNPRVSRSSALASKATGFPIAKIAAKLAVGYTLDEIPNDITKQTPASFEPTIDYCVVKIPRWAFEKFPGSDPTLTIQMKSVGETMSIGRTFKEALQKGLRSLEIDRYGLGSDGKNVRYPAGAAGPETINHIRERLRTPTSERIFYLREAILAGLDIAEIYQLTRIDPWFINNIKDILDAESRLRSAPVSLLDMIRGAAGQNGSPEARALLLDAKQHGFSDRQLAYLWESDEMTVRSARKKLGVEATFKLVDTCAAEFEAYTPYYYSTYSDEDEVRPSEKKKVMILGGGPNRIGQGIEFDYCCVHAAFALKEEGCETIMVNSNPETVSTDYDTSDKLYFEPLALEDVLNICDKEKPDGVIVQFGGQTPLKLAVPLQKAGVPIIGTLPEHIDVAEDRELFRQILDRLGLKQAPSDTAFSTEDALGIANRIGYPVLVRPSYVLGGRAMIIAYDDEHLRDYMTLAREASPDHPILVDKFLDDAIEIDVDAVCDGNDVIVAGIMEHIELAGVHSGDSACVLPPHTLKPQQILALKEQTRALALALNVIGLINIQFAIQNDTIYVLEVNPRASRTVPFVSKATGIPWAKVAARLMIGRKLKELGVPSDIALNHFSVKEAVLPFNKFSGVDTILGPEMKSTGEVMGIDKSFGLAFAKAQMAVNSMAPLKGNVLISVNDNDKKKIVSAARKLQNLGFTLFATRGTARFLSDEGLQVRPVYKVNEDRPNIVDHIKNKEIALIINTPLGKTSAFDEIAIRRAAVDYRIPYITTIAGAHAMVSAIEAIKAGELSVNCLQEYHSRERATLSTSP
ncbi:MAG: carbamoyl-phosphate synthase large subunit [Candidatus Abyssobacteria bacterium SURF_5]|uniref:Carbamoyl phosphate synthase large chain n=1 Tax=Abyssobacteria bacterium (strain SURF_5) TaxID=2093360 RepID=A0A3A4P767_ABYX5|nr:MAG: carbamoyl-phosphate synthase large subunit [Candidatus Abyssubacteria bacterium SURF_5]